LLRYARNDARLRIYSWFLLEAVFIGGNAELVRQFFANQGGSDDACQKSKLGGANEEWQKTAVPRQR